MQIEKVNQVAGFHILTIILPIKARRQVEINMLLFFKGYLTKRELELSLTGSGEPFHSDEMQEMWTAIKGLKLPADASSTEHRTLPPDAVDYASFTKFMMK